MVQPPSRRSITEGRPLGSYQGKQLAKTARDEDCISHLLAAVDIMLDRCKETVRFTGHHIRTWLVRGAADWRFRHRGAYGLLYGKGLGNKVSRFCGGLFLIAYSLLIRSTRGIRRCSIAHKGILIISLEQH